MEIHFTSSTIALAVVKLVILMAAGYILYLRKIINDCFVEDLGQLLVKVVIPCLVASRIIMNFDYAGYSDWWRFPLFGMGYSVFGMLLGFVVSKYLVKNSPVKEFMCSVGIENCGYLPMNLIIFAFSGEFQNRLLIYTFLFMTGFDMLVWSVIPLFLKGDLRGSIKPGIFVTAPMIAIVFSLSWVAVFGKGNFPGLLMDPMSMIGGMGFPMGMIVLGAYLCKHKAIVPQKSTAVIASIFLKLLAFPIIMIILLHVCRVQTDVRFFLFLEAIVPTAVSLVIIGAYTGADNAFFASVIFYSHLFAVFTIPLWLEFYRFIYKI
ncbi:MAG: AEC family transporter [Candidatus Omnitrophica bacterium]|nr:AEC family transporter [Candidatus Omnitrophota bacterium]